MISNDIKESLLPLFEKYKKQLVFAYLFGSHAQNNLFPLSDIDIAVFLNMRKNESYFDMKCSLYAEFCRVLKRNDVDVVMLNTATNIVLLDKIIREGIVLVDRNPSLRVEFELKILHQAIDFKDQRIAIIGN